MRVVGKAGTDLLVSVSKEEFAAVTGSSFYDKLVIDQFTTGAPATYEVLQPVRKTLKITGTVNEVSNLRNTMVKLLRDLDGALEDSQSLESLIGRRLKD